MISTTSQPHQAPNELSTQLGFLLQKAFEFKEKGLIQEALGMYREIDKLTKEPGYPIEMSEETLKSGDLEYGLAFRILDYGDLKDADACWQESLESAKECENKTRRLFCLGRLCVLDICHLKDGEIGKTTAEALSKEYPDWLFFAIIEALAQTTEEEFKEKLDSISSDQMRLDGKRHLKVLKRDYERRKDDEEWSG